MIKTIAPQLRTHASKLARLRARTHTHTHTHMPQHKYTSQQPQHTYSTHKYARMLPHPQQRSDSVFRNLFCQLGLVRSDVPIVLPYSLLLAHPNLIGHLINEAEIVRD